LANIALPLIILGFKERLRQTGRFIS